MLSVYSLGEGLRTLIAGWCETDVYAMGNRRGLRKGFLRLPESEAALFKTVRVLDSEKALCELKVQGAGRNLVRLQADAVSTIVEGELCKPSEMVRLCWSSSWKESARIFSERETKSRVQVNWQLGEEVTEWEVLGTWSSKPKGSSSEKRAGLSGSSNRRSEESKGGVAEGKHGEISAGGWSEVCNLGD